MGAWIETMNWIGWACRFGVAPYMGAWIETANVRVVEYFDTLSLPIWERGLKLNQRHLCF